MIEEAAAAISQGRVVGVPTDTVYGLAAHPGIESAVAELFELKGRPAHKPIGLLASDAEAAGSVARLEGLARELAETHWPGPLTLVVRPAIVLAEWVGDAQARTVGIRVPDHEVCRLLLAATGPLAVTSANASGRAEALDEGEARQVFGDGVAFYVEGRSPGGTPSTVVDVTGARPVVLRQGPLELSLG